MITLISRNKTAQAGSAVILALGLCVLVLTAQQAKAEIGSEAKQVQGEVMWLSDNYITVLFSEDKEKGATYEMMLPIDKNNVVIEHKRNIEEIQRGDIVRVRYVEEQFEDENKEVKKRTRTTVISFIKPAVRKIEAVQPAPEEEEEGAEGLILKGLKQ